MDKISALRALTLAGIALAAGRLHSSAQSTLPPTPQTMQQAPLAATPPPGMTSHTPHRAEITYAEGLLAVRANDSSLNQILRAISRATGMKITGGVQDQRVFGEYGPAMPSAVLATLLDGTGTNILFIEGSPTDAPVLVLTPRGGGPTPPNPMSSTEGDTPDAAPAVSQAPPRPVPPPGQPPAPQAMQPPPSNQPASNTPSGPPSIPQPANNINGSEFNTSPTAATLPTTKSVPTDSLPTPSTTPSSTGIVDAPNPPAPGSTTGTAPNGTATPEQIYQQLLQLQKQQQQPAQIPPH